jgi:hypothetical protein
VTLRDPVPLTQTDIGRLVVGACQVPDAMNLAVAWVTLLLHVRQVTAHTSAHREDGRLSWQRFSVSFLSLFIYFTTG